MFRKYAYAAEKADSPKTDGYSEMQGERRIFIVYGCPSGHVWFIVKLDGGVGDSNGLHHVAEFQGRFDGHIGAHEDPNVLLDEFPEPGLSAVNV